MTKYFFTALALSALFFSCNSKVPVISSIEPKIGNMGDIITLRGRNFGATRDGAYVSIAGVAPTNSSYYTWQDDLILFRIPDSGESGLVFVYVKGKKSNGVLFSNSAAVPRQIEGEDFGMEPKIAAVSPQTGPPGTLITITGNNFGASRENAGVFFSWDYESLSINPYVVTEPEFIEVAETELGYEAWNAHELRIRLPDGAVSGGLKVKTSNGESRSVFFDVTGKPGYKNFKEKRRYTISYSVDVKITEATRPNTLYLWVPLPVMSASQRNVKLVSRSITPFVENHKGVSLFKLDNLVMGSTHSINLSFNVEVYAIETGIRSPIKQGKTPLNAAYTQSTNLIPADNSQIKTTVTSIIGREQNPYIKAKLIYDWIINNIKFTEIPFINAGAVSALEQKKADSYSAALLYTAMVRAAKVPCIPTAGVLINRHSQTMRHYWAEVWIDDFGWLPVDPVLGAGAAPDSYINKEESELAGYYFGNIDSQRIAFSRGELHLSQMESRGRLVSHTQSYSLQNIWEEAAGGLESYSSLWGDIIINGTYVQ